MNMGHDGTDIMMAVFVVVSDIVWVLQCNFHTSVCLEGWVGRCELYLRVLDSVCEMEAGNGPWSLDSMFLDML